MLSHYYYAREIVNRRCHEIVGMDLLSGILVAVESGFTGLADYPDGTEQQHACPPEGFSNSAAITRVRGLEEEDESLGYANIPKRCPLSDTQERASADVSHSNDRSD